MIIVISKFLGSPVRVYLFFFTLPPLLFLLLLVSS